jgi:RNA polymerase sigma-70 factor, ECF subfamily
MDINNRYDGIDKYASRLIRIKARTLVGKYGFTESDSEDLEQELKLDLVRRLPKYKPDRAQLNTFIAHVVEHKIANIIESQKAGQRDYRLCYCSLNENVADEEGNSMERLEIFDPEKYLIRTGRLSRSNAELNDLTQDIDRVIKQLSPELRELCQRLKNNSVTEISRETGIPRGTIYDYEKKLRTIFEDAGLCDYL